MIFVKITIKELNRILSRLPDLDKWLRENGPSQPYRISYLQVDHGSPTLISFFVDFTERPLWWTADVSFVIIPASQAIQRSIWELHQ